MNYVIARMKLPEIEYETMVTIPSPVLGEIPEHYVAHIFKLYPTITTIQFFDGQNVREYKAEIEPEKKSSIITVN